jgi:hypothetical protein
MHCDDLLHWNEHARKKDVWGTLVHKSSIVMVLETFVLTFFVPACARG